jgi:sugar phosphate permease
MFWLPVALTLWGLSRGLYEANIFASVFDVVRPEARGTATGFMNTMGWLVGGGISPIVVGFLAERQGLSVAIAVTSSSYVVAGLLLFTGVLFFVRHDAAKMETEIAADVQPIDI